MAPRFRSLGAATTGLMHQLYRLHDNAGQLLYIGLSTQVSARLRSHRASKRWWSEVVSVTTEDVGTDGPAAFRVEALAILREQPRHNIAGKRVAVAWVKYLRNRTGFGYLPPELAAHNQEILRILDEQDGLTRQGRQPD